ncbi:hypothetical protein BHE74_00045960 [Ensete ventricosum]|nr:hypothetical protein BHE74_00045960 [Ensete ventricosum]
MGGTIPCRPDHPRWDLHLSHNGWPDPPSDMTHLKLEEVLRLIQQSGIPPEQGIRSEPNDKVEQSMWDMK